MKRIIGIVITLALLIYAGVYTYKYIYVPKGETFRLVYTNLRKSPAVGKAEEEKVELTKNGLFTRTSFTYNDDAVEYLFSVINDGTIPAKLSRDPLYLTMDYYTKKHISYTALYEDGSEIKAGDTIKPGETKIIRVKIIYLHPADIATQNSQFYESRLVLLFKQDR